MPAGLWGSHRSRADLSRDRWIQSPEKREGPRANSSDKGDAKRCVKTQRVGSDLSIFSYQEKSATPETKTRLKSVRAPVVCSSIRPGQQWPWLRPPPLPASSIVLSAPSSLPMGIMTSPLFSSLSLLLAFGPLPAGPRSAPRLACTRSRWRMAR